MNKKHLLLTLLAGFMILLLAACSQSTLEPTAVREQQPETSAPEPSATENVFTPVFEEAPCPFEQPEEAAISCGFVLVPEDHFSHTERTLRIAVAVFRDQSPGHQLDPVILLSGGPGEKTLANASQLASFLAPLYPNRDLIVFDQRGVGLSEPALECPGWEQAQFEVLDESDLEVVMQTTFDALMRCRDRLVNEGHNLAAYTTLQNAADVDAIRQALGYEQMNLYGGSYGSHLAQAVMRDFPEGIRSVVLTSIYPLERSLIIDATTSTADALLQLVDRCMADEACNQAYPDLEKVLFEVVDRLNAEPLEITLTNPIDGQEYESVLTGDAAFSNLAALLYQTQLIPAIPQAIYDVYHEDYALITQLRSINLIFLEALSRGMEFSVLCADDLIGKTPADLLAARAELPPELNSPRNSELLIEYGLFGICEKWPVEEAGAWVKEPVISELPTLLLAGEFDPVTPPEYGQLVASHLSQGYFYEFPGIGHDITIASACAREMAGAFLDDPTQAPDDSCKVEAPPLAFDLPSESSDLVLEPFVDEARGFQGLVPVGWQELAPANMVRRNTTLDPTYYVLEAKPGTAQELFADVVGQLGMDTKMEPVKTADVGSFTWKFYTFELKGDPVDLALAEDAERAYFVALISPPDEREVLFETLFLPAVEAMAPLLP